MISHIVRHRLEDPLGDDPIILPLMASQDLFPCSVSVSGKGANWRQQNQQRFSTEYIIENFQISTTLWEEYAFALLEQKFELSLLNRRKTSTNAVLKDLKWLASEIDGGPLLLSGCPVKHIGVHFKGRAAT
ncbi:unnamed protein product [Sphagnum balticum]